VKLLSVIPTNRIGRLSILSRFADETEAKLSIDASIKRLAKDVLLDTKISYLKAFATKFELIKFQISEKETAASILEAELAKQAVRIAEYKEEEKTIKSSKAPGRVRISL
jgi:hypothetical protein